MEFENYPTIKKWLSRVGENTGRSYRDHLRLFFKWEAKNNGPFSGMNPDQLIQHQKDNREYDILDEVQLYISELRARAASRRPRPPSSS